MGNEDLISDWPTGNLALDTRELAVIGVGNRLGVDVYHVLHGHDQEHNRGA